MNNRHSKEAILALCDLWGMRVNFEVTRGNHTRVTITSRVQASAVMYIAGTPSDWRALQNNITRARRLLRALTTAGPGERISDGPRCLTLPREQHL